MFNIKNFIPIFNIMLPDFSEIEKRIAEGFLLEELEARLRPTSEESTWANSSGGGFLAPDESLMEVVRNDYETLRFLGKDYVQMTQIASNVLEQSRRETFVRGNRLTRGARRFLAEHLRPTAGIDRKKYNLMRVGSFGHQSCPWNCNGQDSYGYPTSGSGHVYVMERGKETSDLMEKYLQIQIESSDREFPELSFNEAQEARRKVLRELERSIGIDFGGMDRVLYLSAFTVVTDLTPHLIGSHYFFEGDASYRTEPVKLLKLVGI